MKKGLYSINYKQESTVAYDVSKDSVIGLIRTMRLWIKTAMTSVADEKRTPQEIMDELPELLPLLEELEAKVAKVKA